jgi:hypothetical protein
MQIERTAETGGQDLTFRGRAKPQAASGTTRVIGLRRGDCKGQEVVVGGKAGRR